MGLGPRGSPRYLPATGPRGQGQVFSNFFFLDRGVEFSPLSIPEFGTRTPGGGRALSPSLGLGAGPPRTAPRLLSFPAPTFPSEQVAGAAHAREGRSIAARLPPGAAAAGPRGGRAGRSPGCASVLVTWSGRAPRGWPREEEEGDRLAEGRAGRKAREALPSVRSGLWEARRGAGAGARPAGGVRGASVGPRLGDAVAPAWGGRAGREAAPGGAAEGPRGARPGSQLPSAAPTAGLASRWGRGRQRAPLRVSNDVSSVWEEEPLCRGARTAGRND